MPLGVQSLSGVATRLDEEPNQRIVALCGPAPIAIGWHLPRGDAPSPHESYVGAHLQQVLAHQRPYQRRRPIPESTPPTKKPSSQSATATSSTNHNTCAAKPRPPNKARINSSTIKATTASYLLSSLSPTHALPRAERPKRHDAGSCRSMTGIQ